MRKNLGKLDVELQTENKELARLQGELADTQSHITELTAQRGTAVRLVAKGDDKAAGIVREIDAKLDKLRVRAEGFAGLVADLSGEIETLTAKIDQTRTAYDSEKASFVQKGLADQAWALLADLPARQTRASQLFLEFCLELGTWQQDAAFVSQTLGTSELQDALNSFHGVLFKRVEDSPYKRMVTGPHGRISLHTMVSAPALQGAYVNLNEVVAAFTSQRQAELMNEFNSL